MWPDKIITKFVHKNLITGINVAAGDHLAAFVTRTACYLEIVRQGRLRSVDPMRSPVSDDSRPGKEEKILLFYDFPDGLVFGRDQVDVVAAQDEEFGNLT